jgi:hypothetical protein
MSSISMFIEILWDGDVWRSIAFRMTSVFHIKIANIAKYGICTRNGQSMTSVRSDRIAYTAKIKQRESRARFLTIEACGSPIVLAN